MTVIDVRTRRDFANAHIPGSLGVELRDDFGTWAGWMVDINEPIVLVGEEEQDLREAVLQLARIGYDKISGIMLGMEQWIRQGLPVRAYNTATPSEFVEAISREQAILDVRSPSEFSEQSIPGSIHIYVPDIAQEPLDKLRLAQDIWVICGSGYRATIAAGMSEAHGYSPTVLTDAGVGNILRQQSTDATQTS